MTRRRSFPRGSPASSSLRRRLWPWLCITLSVAALALLLVPEGRLGCADPTARETSPDDAWTLTLCRRPMWFAMPGGSGDAPGWIVLRDAEGAIRGVSEIGMVQLYGAGGGGTVWRQDQVAVPLIAELPLRPARNGVARWLEDRLWRLRALLGLTTTDDMFR